MFITNWSSSISMCENHINTCCVCVCVLLDTSMILDQGDAHLD